jgi:hypothetical protein
MGFPLAIYGGLHPLPLLPLSLELLTKTIRFCLPKDSAAPVRTSEPLTILTTFIKPIFIHGPLKTAASTLDGLKLNTS